MRRMAMMMMVGAAALAVGAAELNPTNYWTGYVLVPSSSTNSGSTGLVVSNAYVAIPLTALSTYVTEAQAGTTTNGDVRAVFYAIAETLYQGYAASTNAPANQTIERGLTIQSNGTNVDAVVLHAVTTKRRINTSSIPAED